MTTPASSQTPDPRPHRVLEIFLAARALPVDRREAFVRQQAGADSALADEVLALLRDADAAGSSKVFAAGQAAMANLADGLEAGQAEIVPSTEDLQSTATGELLRRLAEAPKLDTNRYALEDEVGRGGMGVVLRIFDRHLNRRLAMKVMQQRHARGADSHRGMQRELGHFLEEAQVTSQLDHPGVVPVHELGLDQDGKVYFTMRLVKGRTAAEIFALARSQQEEWTTTRALEVILKVCDTIAYAHARGVLHRDLKPSNVMVGRFGEVYVMDWGLAKVLRSDGDQAAGDAVAADVQVETVRQRDAEQDREGPMGSVAGQVKGTAEYMPPEQRRGASLDRRADVYSIGAMLYELLAGRPPYTPAEIARGALAGPPQRVEAVQPGVPAELVAIVEKGMHRDRERRYGSVLELAADLRAFLDQCSVKAYRTGALVELKLWVRRNKSLAASLAAAVLILVLGIGLTTWLATENAALANSESAAKVAATQLAQEKGRTVANFNQLSAVVRLKDALTRQDQLWPPWPDKVAALQSWLDNDCAQLLAMRPQIDATIADLRTKALPLTADQVEADRRTAAEWPAFERQQQLVMSLQRAQAIRSGAAKLELPELPAPLRDADASALNSFAWPRVAPEKPDREKPERTMFGEEAAALVAARAAVAKSAGKPDEFPFLLTLAWAALANGQDEEAKQRTSEALSKVPGKERETYLGHQRDIEAAIAAAPTRLASAEAKLGALDSVVSVRRTWTFGSDEEGRSAEFLHNALVDALAGLDAMAAKEKVDVEQRLIWARQVRAASLAHPQAGATWAATRTAIAQADDVVASKLYAGCDISLPDEALVGLVPIGMNPVTKLWEFYDLRSAWDGKQGLGEIPIPEHNPDGSIEVTGATGIVFVLLPGGSVTLGSQRHDENAPYFDPQHRSHEKLHEAMLTPFFLARHEMTQGQWSRLLTWDAALRFPSNYKGGAIGGRSITLANPVEQVDWSLSTKLLARHGQVLPTEAQWEYGCRGGTTTPWSVAFDDLRKVANVADAELKREVPTRNCESWSDGHVVHAPVGSFAANPFGLHDMHGNLWEWCRDPYGDYGSERSGDGARPELAFSPVLRCSRGGNWLSDASAARSANRSNNAQFYRDYQLGLRPARLISN